MLICRNAAWVHGQIYVGNPWFRNTSTKQNIIKDVAVS